MAPLNAPRGQVLPPGRVYSHSFRALVPWISAGQRALPFRPCADLRVARTPNHQRVASTVPRESKFAARSTPALDAVAPSAPRYLSKVRKVTVTKAIQNQPLTSSVLNPRSREVWRKTAEEREFRVSVGASQCGGFHAKPVVIGLLCALGSRRRMLGADRLAEGVSASYVRKALVSRHIAIR